LSLAIPALAGALLSTQSVAAQSVTAEQASSASAFTDSVGVVTHFSYTDTPYYTNFPEILNGLKTLGVRHIRDGYYNWPADSPIIGFHKQLLASGIKTSYVVPYDPTTSPADIKDLAAETGDMEALEGPNECDIYPCGGTGNTGVINAASFMPVVNQAGNELGIPVIGPSFTQQGSYPVAGNLSSVMTYNNLHVYFGGRNPGSTGWGDPDPQGNAYGSFNWWLDQAQIDGPGKESYITETGYITTPTTTTPYTLPESVAASYMPRSLLLAFNHGVKKTFMYELLDEVSSPGYGLLRSDLSPKPAFNAVKNLLATLADTSATPGAATAPAPGTATAQVRASVPKHIALPRLGSGTASTPGSLEYAITGADSTLNHVLLQKQDGSFWLVLWLEQPSWDPVNVAPIQVAPQNISLQLGGAYKTVTNYQFDSNGNVTPVNQPMNGNVANLTVSDQISIIQIVPR
jgi:hypothetical protein